MASRKSTSQKASGAKAPARNGSAKKASAPGRGGKSAPRKAGKKSGPTTAIIPPDQSE